nr:MATE family efflux transporter [uncultured Shimia sp.]
MKKQGRFLTGSTMGHVVRMTLTGAVGITFIFLVDLANLFWVSKVGDPKLVAAMGYAFAIQFFSISTGIGLMIASTALVSRQIGMGDHERARHEATSAMIITVLCQTVVAVVVIVFRYPLLDMVGATAETLEHAARYLLLTIPSLTVMAVGLVGSAILRAEGDGMRSMFVTLSAGVVAMVIDPVLILWLGMGLDGASLVINISRLVLAIVALRFAIGTHDMLARPALWAIRRSAKPFFAIAIPAILTQISTPFGNYLLTGAIANFGDSAVAAWAVVNRLTVVAFGGIFALSGAVGGIFGQNFGAGNIERLRCTYRDALIFCAGYTVLAWAVLMLTAPHVVRGFGLSGQGADVYNAFAFVGAGAFILVGALFVSNAAFNNLGKPTRSTAANWLRDGVLTLPAALLGAAWFGAPGVVYAQSVVGALVGVLAAIWCWRFIVGMGAAR